MSKYIVRRILSLVPVLIGVSFVVFIIISMTPGDAVDILLPPDATEAEFEMLREEFGLNKPLLLQYWRYLAGMLRGDLGTSWYTHDSVFVSFVQRLPATAALTLASMLVSIVLAIPLGVFSSLHPGSPADKAFATMSFLGVSMPSFWIGLMLIIVFAVQWRILPSGGSGTPAHLVLPSIVLGINHSAEIMRMTRASMLDIINSDFIRMARSKGIGESAVIYRHGLRNAIIPVLTVMGHQFANGFGGSTVIETVFSWPGVGRLIIESIHRQDRPMVMGCLILITALISITNLVVDIIYAFVDPRIRAEYSKKKQRRQ